MQRLRELGWVEGRTVAIEYHWAEGRRERAAEIAAEYVRLKVDVIIAATSPACQTWELISPVSDSKSCVRSSRPCANSPRWSMLNIRAG